MGTNSWMLLIQSEVDGILVDCVQGAELPRHSTLSDKNFFKDVPPTPSTWYNVMYNLTKSLLTIYLGLPVTDCAKCNTAL
jgi:hypothetical protein